MRVNKMQPNIENLARAKRALALWHKLEEKWDLSQRGTITKIIKLIGMARGNDYSDYSSTEAQNTYEYKCFNKYRNSIYDNNNKASLKSIDQLAANPPADAHFEILLKLFNENDQREIRFTGLILPDGLSLGERLRQVFHVETNAAQIFIDHCVDASTGQVLMPTGYVLPLWSTHFARRGGFDAEGVPVHGIRLEDAQEEHRVPSEYLDESIPVRGADLRKFMLAELPPSTFDSQSNDFSLQLMRTSYSTIQKSNPFFYSDHKLRRDPSHAYGDARENILNFATRNPKYTRIPYALTLFFVIRLSDGNLLYMKRSKETPWYPNTFDFSGGEQLDAKDFVGRYVPLVAWLRRGILEEYFPVEGVADEEYRSDLFARFCRSASCVSVSVNTFDHSFPITVLVQSNMDTNQYVKAFWDAQGRWEFGQVDAEGERGVITPTQLRELLTEGKTQTEVLYDSVWLKKRDDGTFEKQLRRSVSEHAMHLSPDQMHPMSPYHLLCVLSAVDVRDF
ncbi:MAG: hypothetical protein ACN6I5_01380 [Hyphomicrobiales bacterium]